ncbi:MAG: hypothetical protein AAGF12_08900 [Myxococcota bacterium]
MMRVQRYGWVVCGLIMTGGVVGCDSEPGVATEALTQCAADSDCGAGLGCVCGICTRDCTDDGACGAFGAEARCLSASCGAAQVCGIPCTTSMECPSSLSCIGGQCAVPAPIADASVDRAVPDAMGDATVDAMIDATVDAPDDAVTDGDAPPAVTGVTCEVRRRVPGCRQELQVYRDVEFYFDDESGEFLIASDMPGFFDFTAVLRGEFFANDDRTEYTGLVDVVLHRTGDVLSVSFSATRQGFLTDCDPEVSLIDIDCRGTTRLTAVACYPLLPDPSPLTCEVTRRDAQCNVVSTSSDNPTLALSGGPHGPGTTLLADSPVLREAFSSSGPVPFTTDLCDLYFTRGGRRMEPGPGFARTAGLQFGGAMDHSWGERCSNGAGRFMSERNSIRCTGSATATP